MILIYYVLQYMWCYCPFINFLMVCRSFKRKKNNYPIDELFSSIIFTIVVKTEIKRDGLNTPNARIFYQRWNQFQTKIVFKICVASRRFLLLDKKLIAKAKKVIAFMDCTTRITNLEHGFLFCLFVFTKIIFKQITRY